MSLTRAGAVRRLPGMKSSTLIAFAVLASASRAYPDQETSMLARVVPGRPPLKPKPYLELPLGAIRPRGWLLVQLERQRDGLTGRLDEIYPKVVGPRNGWLG